MDRDAALTPRSFERAADAAWRDRLAILAPVLILVVLGALEALRPAGVLVLLAGLAAVSRPVRPATLAWAAVLPVAIELAWPVLVGRDGALGQLCADPFTDIVVRRFAQVALILSVVVLLGRWLGLGPATIGWRRPGLPAITLAGAAGSAVAVGGVVTGPMLTTPFFGTVGFVAPLATIVPALLFAVANGVLEEVTYRGVLMRWLGRLVGVPTALIAQAVVFGLAHAGPEIAPAMLPLHITIMAACGLALGLLVLRTRSLTLAIGVHIGADVALYFGLACRTL
jgi:membrane protease YdiL (CAAX protease family)